MTAMLGRLGIPETEGKGSLMGLSYDLAINIPRAVISTYRMLSGRPLPRDTETRYARYISKSPGLVLTRLGLWF